jgi:F-type H+-transporting ATPase subunit epsilon
MTHKEPFAASHSPRPLTPNPSTMSELRCIVVTPEETVRDEPAEFVALTLFDGEIGIAPGHTPMIGRLSAGELRIKHGGQTEHYYVEGGFVEVVDNVVSVLTHKAVAAAAVDEAVAQEQLTSVLGRPATTLEQMAVRERVVEQSRAQLRVARRAHP